MKKLFVLILALVLLLPVLAAADDSSVVGCWASYQLLTTGCPCMTMLYLADDYTCYYFTQMYEHDEVGFGRAFIGSWEMQRDGSVFVKIGNNATLTLELYGSNNFAVSDTLDVYVNISEFTLK